MSRSDLHPAFAPILGRSPALIDALKSASQAATTPWPILVLGETGTGKTAVAEAIHEASGRSGKFVAINCAALAPTLLESQLFGYVQGAFTGAHADTPGLFQTADGGTLFLDEIGDMTPDAQARLLRVVETGRVRAIGAGHEDAVDVRLVAATHRELEERCRDGRFREDLLYRIGAFRLTLPPLRDRGEDVAVLAEAFLSTTDPDRSLSPAVVALLGMHAWPGNLRELQSVIRQAVVEAGDSAVILPAHLPPLVRPATVPRVPGGAGSVSAVGPDPVALLRKALASDPDVATPAWAGFLLAFARANGVSVIQRADMMEHMRAVRGPDPSDNVLRLEWNRERRPWLVKQGLLTVRNRRYLSIEFAACEALAPDIADAPIGLPATSSASSRLPGLEEAAPVEPLRPAGPGADVTDRQLTNLPVRKVRLIGRDSEIVALSALLTGDSPLVTLTGPGGVGKTSLALATGQALLDRFPAGVWFVDLVAARTAADVALATSDALGLPRQSTDPAGQVAAALASGGRRLVILDNFEQVTTTANETVGDWTSRAPEARVLVTSRHLLGLRRETRVQVEPLPAPVPPPDSRLEVLAASEAVQLFVARAGAACPGFELTADNAAHVATICSAVSGLPLAIEMAAARVKVLPPADLSQRLSKSLGVLRSSRRDLPEHQRALRDTLQWSLDLLDDSECDAFFSLCVFRGGFTLAAAEAVLAADALAVLDVVESLIDKSLLQHREAFGGVRYTFYPVIREYGLEQLGNRFPAERCATLQTRHAEWVERRFGQIHRSLDDVRPETRDAAWHDADAEVENLVAAMDAAWDAGDVELGARLTLAGGEVAEQRDEVARPLTWLKRALAHADSLPSAQRIRLRLLYLLRQANVTAGARDQQEMLDEVIDELEQLPVEALPQRDHWLMTALLHRATHRYMFGEFESSDSDFDRAGQLAGDDAIARINLFLSRASRHIQARERDIHAEYVDRAERLARRLGRQRLLYRCLIRRALVVVDEGNLDEARACMREAREWFEHTHDPMAETTWYGYAAKLEVVHGDAGTGLELARHQSAVAARYGIPLSYTAGQGWQARALLRLGRYDEAMEQIGLAITPDVPPASRTYLLVHGVHALAALRLGNPDPLIELLDEHRHVLATGTAELQCMVLAGGAEARAMRQDAEGARREIAGADAIAQEQGFHVDGHNRELADALRRLDNLRQQVGA